MCYLMRGVFTELTKAGCRAIQNDERFAATGQIQSRKKANLERQQFLAQTIELFEQVGRPKTAGDP